MPKKYVTVKLSVENVIRIERALMKEMHEKVNEPSGFKKLKTKPWEQVPYWTEEDKRERDAYIRLWHKFWNMAENAITS